MSINRRDFIRASLGSAALASLAACSNDSAGGCCASKDAKLNISFQEGTAPGENLNEKLDFMEKLGVVGLEVGGSVRGGLFLDTRVDEFQKALSGRNIKISAICAGFRGFVLSEEDAVRQEFHDTMKVIIQAAGALGSTGVIFVPAFNRQVPVKPHTADTRFSMRANQGIGTICTQSEYDSYLRTVEPPRSPLPASGKRCRPTMSRH